MIHDIFARAREWRACASAAVLVTLLVTGPAAASDEAGACLGHISGTEKSEAIPQGLMKAIGFTESGRTTADGRRVPWPWTVNAQGQGHYFETKKDAIAFVQELQAAGVRVIDVGCMQVNLYYHPNAFASLDAAFDPATNVAYAATFLNELKAETGDWGVATQYYHSRTPYLGQAYAGRVTLNASGKVISNVGPIKPLTAEEKAAIADTVPDALAAADALIAKSRAMRQPKSAVTAVEQAAATIEADIAPAAGPAPGFAVASAAPLPAPEIAASTDLSLDSTPSVTSKRGHNR